MVSIGKIILMMVCVVFSIATMAIPYFMIKRRSSKLETGLLGALCYGFLGYIWQYLIYMFCGFAVAKGMMAIQAPQIVVQLVITLVTTILTILSLIWGIYLTNQRQRSIYRSATIGIGFSAGKTGIDLIYSYCYSIFFAFQINNGTYGAGEELKQSIISSTPGSILLGTYKCFLMFLIIFALSLVMGRLYLDGKMVKMCVVSLGIYETIMIVNVLFGLIPNAIVSEVLLLLFLTGVAVVAAGILYRWFQSEKVRR